MRLLSVALARDEIAIHNCGGAGASTVANCVLEIIDDSGGKFPGCDLPKRDQFPLRFGI
jgi:hypothetical protein